MDEVRLTATSRLLAMCQFGISIGPFEQFHVRGGVVTLHSLYNNVESEHGVEAQVLKLCSEQPS